MLTGLEALTIYLRHLRDLEYSPATIYTRERQLLRLQHFLAPRDLIADVDEDDLLRWQHDDLTHCGPKARATAIAHVRGFYRWADLHDHLPRKNPARRLQRPRLPRALPRPIAEDDLLLAIETAPMRIRPWIALAGWAGMRACEIAQLRREDILDNVESPVVIVRGKGAKERTVPIGPGLLAELRRHGLPAQGYVFPRYDGEPGPNMPHRISKLVNLHLHGLGITSTLHKMRHRFGSQTYEFSKDLRVVQELLGHSDPKTTAIYAAFSNAGASAVCMALDCTLPQPGRLRLLAPSS